MTGHPDARPFDDLRAARATLASAVEGDGDPDLEAVAWRLLATCEELDDRRRGAESEARRDALTGLINRRGWLAAIHAEQDRLQRSGRRAVICVVDIDGLKEVNDERGHHAGDRLLIGIAMTLTMVSRRTDVVARLGGDEFAILAVESDDAEAFVERVQSALTAARLEASVGAVVASDDLPLRDAWEEADRLMYARKAARRT